MANCALIGTHGYGKPGVSGDSNSFGVTVSVNVLNENSVFVEVADPNGTAANNSFFVALLC